MATTNFSQLSDAQLDQLYQLTQNSPGLIPNPAERQAVIDEWSRRKTGLAPRGPDNVERDLEASATPITPDPAVKPKAAKPPLRQRMEQRLIDAGRTPEEAARGVDADFERNAGTPGEMNEALFERYNTPANNAALARRVAEGRVVEGRQAAFESDYNAATGLGNDAALPPMEGYNEHTGEYTTPRVLHPMIARDRAIAQQQEAEHAAMIEAKYGQEIAARWRAGDKSAIIPQHIKDANAEWAQTEKDAYSNPSVLVREAARQRLRDREERTRNNPSYVEREIVRWSDATGLPPAQVRQMLAKDPAQARAMLRDDANGQRAAARRAAKDHWRAVTMLAGGSQNINGANRAFFNQLAMLPPQERMQQLQYALPGGAERAAVDSRSLDVAARLAGNAIAGQLGGFAQAANPVVQNQVAQQQLAQQQEAVQWAEDNINANYAWDADSWLESDFTEAERTQAINDLMVRYGPPNGRMTLAEATRIVDNIGARKRRPAKAAPSGGPGDDAGAMPAVSA